MIVDTEKGRLFRQDNRILQLKHTKVDAGENWYYFTAYIHQKGWLVKQERGEILPESTVQEEWIEISEIEVTGIRYP